MDLQQQIPNVDVFHAQSVSGSTVQAKQIIFRAGLNPVCMCGGDILPLCPVTVLIMVKRQAVLCSVTISWCSGFEDAHSC